MKNIIGECILKILKKCMGTPPEITLNPWSYHQIRHLMHGDLVKYDNKLFVFQVSSGGSRRTIEPSDNCYFTRIDGEWKRRMETFSEFLDENDSEYYSKNMQHLRLLPADHAPTQLYQCRAVADRDTFVDYFSRGRIICG